MNKILFMLLVFLYVLVSVSGCVREKPATESVTAPPASANISVGGGGQALTLLPSDPEESFKNAVLNADLIVSGNITGQKYELVPYPNVFNTGNATRQENNLNAGNITQGKAYTIFTLTVEIVIKGDAATKEVFVKVPGGYIGEVYQVPTGDYFQISDHVLVMLHREDDNIFTISRLAWLRGSVIISEPELNDVIVRVIQVMRANNVPVALPEAEWPPLIEIAPPSACPAISVSPPGLCPNAKNSSPVFRR